MSEKIKHIIPFLLVACVVLTSCDSKSYDTGDGDMSYLKAEYADITVHNGKVTAIMTDDGEQLRVDGTMVVEGLLPVDTMLRRLIYYNVPRPSEPVEIMKSTVVSIVSPRAKEDFKVMKTDAVKLMTSWLSRNKAYVNLRLGLMVGNDAPQNALHVLSLRLDSVSHVGKGRVFLSLYHDQADVPQYYTEEAHLSIPMPEQDTVTVTVNTYDGIVTHTFMR